MSHLMTRGGGCLQLHVYIPNYLSLVSDNRPSKCYHSLADAHNCQPIAPDHPPISITSTVQMSEDDMYQFEDEPERSRPCSRHRLATISLAIFDSESPHTCAGVLRLHVIGEQNIKQIVKWPT